MRYDFLTGSGAISGHGSQATDFRLPDDIDLTDFEIPDDVIERMPEPVAWENTCLPLALVGDTLHVACDESDNVSLQDKIRFLLNCNVRFHKRGAREIRRGIRAHYRSIEGQSADSLIQEFTDTAIDFTETEDLMSLESLGDLSTPAPAKTRRKSLSRMRAGMAQGGQPQFGSRNSFFSRENLAHNQGDGMFYYTVREGEKVVKQNKNGSIDIIEGPRRIWKGSTKFQPMQHFVAHPGQFLIARFRDGKQNHYVGPCDLWLDPRVHSDIEVKEALSLAAKEAVVVYGAAERW